MDGRRKSDTATDDASEGETVNLAEALREEMTIAFEELFPWRNPNSKLKKKNEKDLQEALQFTTRVWNDLGNKLYIWLQKEKQNRANKTGDKGKQPATTRRAKRGKQREAESPPLDVYGPNPDELLKEEKSFLYLMEQSRKPWSAIDPEELVSRKKRLADDMRNVVRAVSRATGAEMVLYGVWQKPGEKKLLSTEISSWRARYFLSLLPSINLRQTFTSHIAQLCGPHLATDIDDPAATIYDDPSRNYMPMWPNQTFSELHTQRLLELYMQLFWLWTGGLHDVPYRLMMEDAVSGTYAMAELRRYPPDVPVLNPPLSMTQPEVTSWVNHILAGQEERIEPPRRWRFVQPSPGKYDSYTREHISGSSTLHFPPECHAFANHRMAQLPQGSSKARDDELPTVPEDDSPHCSVIPEKVDELKRLLGAEMVFARLLDALQQHDEAGPYELTRDAYLELRTSMPLLGNTIPATNDDIGFLVQEPGGFISPQYYRQLRAEDRAWRLFSLLNSCEANKWIHAASGTMVSGRYGVKWPVLMLVFLRLNQQMIQAANPKLPDSYAGLDAALSSRDVEEVEIIRTGGRGGAWLENFSPNDLGGVDINCAPEPTDEWTQNQLSRAVIPDPQASIYRSKKRTTRRKARFSLPGDGGLGNEASLSERSTTDGDNTTISAKSDGEDDDAEEMEEEDQLADDEAVEPEVKGDGKSEKSGAPPTSKVLTKKDTMKPRKTY
ncbi:hypothetical protein FRC09_015466 [Ceratobasidium sp. 395]|nr:hypothetical protein FRC09_015466 [Ceratobasidium sp. 395]